MKRATVPGLWIGHRHGERVPWRKDPTPFTIRPVREIRSPVVPESGNHNFVVAPTLNHRLHGRRGTIRGLPSAAVVQMVSVALPPPAGGFPTPYPVRTTVGGRVPVSHVACCSTPSTAPGMSGTSVFCAQPLTCEEGSVDWPQSACTMLAFDFTPTATT